MAHDLDPVALQRVDKLLDHLDIDQRAGTPGDILKTAILEMADDSARQGQMMAGKAIAAILGGDLLVVEDDGGDGVCGMHFIDKRLGRHRVEAIDNYIDMMETLTASARSVHRRRRGFHRPGRRMGKR